MPTTMAVIRRSPLPLLLAIVSACASNPAPTSAPSSGAIDLRSRPQLTPAACMAALTQGTVVRDARSGLGLRDATGHVQQVIWPIGYAGRDDGGRVALIDGSGRIVAHEGDRVSIGGGEFGADDAWLACDGTVQVLAP